MSVLNQTDQLVVLRQCTLTTSILFLFFPFGICLSDSLGQSQTVQLWARGLYYSTRDLLRDLGITSLRPCISHFLYFNSRVRRVYFRQHSGPVSDEGDVSDNRFRALEASQRPEVLLFVHAMAFPCDGARGAQTSSLQI